MRLLGSLGDNWQRPDGREVEVEIVAAPAVGGRGTADAPPAPAAEGGLRRGRAAGPPRRGGRTRTDLVAPRWRDTIVVALEPTTEAAPRCAWPLGLAPALGCERRDRRRARRRILDGEQEVEDGPAGRRRAGCASAASRSRCTCAATDPVAALVDVAAERHARLVIVGARPHGAPRAAARRRLRRRRAAGAVRRAAGAVREASPHPGASLCRARGRGLRRDHPAPARLDRAARRCSSSAPRRWPPTATSTSRRRARSARLRGARPHTVAYLDVTGSGAETIAHLRENGRICVMFCAFEGPPRIVRLHGRGRGGPQRRPAVRRAPARGRLRRRVDPRGAALGRPRRRRAGQRLLRLRGAADAPTRASATITRCPRPSGSARSGTATRRRSAPAAPAASTGCPRWPTTGRGRRRPLTRSRAPRVARTASSPSRGTGGAGATARRRRPDRLSAPARPGAVTRAGLGGATVAGGQLS